MLNEGNGCREVQVTTVADMMHVGVVPNMLDIGLDGFEPAQTAYAVEHYSAEKRVLPLGKRDESEVISVLR